MNLCSILQHPNKHSALASKMSCAGKSLTTAYETRATYPQLHQPNYPLFVSAQLTTPYTSNTFQGSSACNSSSLERLQ